MAESTLSMEYSDFVTEVADYLGYSEVTQIDRINFAIKEGLRQFYFPPPIDTSGKSHRWSFLQNEYQLLTVADTWQYDLPDLFGSPIGNELQFGEASNCVYSVIITGVQQIRNKRQLTDSTGRPQFAAIRPKNPMQPNPATGGERFEIILHPTPDAVYTLYLPYSVLTPIISEDYPYPLGGAAHSSTILASCLAAAEASQRDGETIKRDIFKERLASSISMDRRNDVSFLGKDPRASRISSYGTVLEMTFEGEIYGQ